MITCREEWVYVHELNTLKQLFNCGHPAKYIVKESTPKTNTAFRSSGASSYHFESGMINHKRVTEAEQTAGENFRNCFE